MKENFKIFKILFILFSESYIAAPDAYISPEQAYVRILAYLKLLMMTYASILWFGESRYVIKFWNTDVCASAISEGLIQL